MKIRELVTLLAALTPDQQECEYDVHNECHTGQATDLEIRPFCYRFKDGTACPDSHDADGDEDLRQVPPQILLTFSKE